MPDLLCKIWVPHVQYAFPIMVNVKTPVLVFTQLITPVVTY